MAVLIRYFIPADGDDPEHPNAFRLNTNGLLRVKDVRENFPIQGNFHFRFKKNFGSSHVWVDAVLPEDPVPRSDGGVVAKVERLPGGGGGGAGAAAAAAAAEFGTTTKASLSQEKQFGRLLSMDDVHSNAAPSGDLLGGFDSAVGGGAQQVPPSSAAGAGEDLFGVFDAPPAAPAPAPAPASASGVDPFAGSPAPPLQQSQPPVPLQPTRSPAAAAAAGGGLAHSRSNPHLGGGQGGGGAGGMVMGAVGGGMVGTGGMMMQQQQHQQQQQKFIRQQQHHQHPNNFHHHHHQQQQHQQNNNLFQHHNSSPEQRSKMFQM